MKVTVNPRNNLTATKSNNKTVLVNQSGTVKNIEELNDVDLSNKEDGSLLIYDANQNKFLASTLLDKQKVNGGHF